MTASDGKLYSQGFTKGYGKVFYNQRGNLVAMRKIQSDFR